MRKLNSQKGGTSTLVVIVAIIMVILLGMIIVPKLMNSADDELQKIDQNYVTAAENSAKMIFAQDGEAFIKVYDSENKKFVERRLARTTVNPYGTSKEHIGMYLLVTVDASGAITTEWIMP